MDEAHEAVPKRPKGPMTLTDCYVRHMLPDDSPARAPLERCRIEYEAAHGPTDPTQYYTSMRPLEEQCWLLENHPTLFWDGLPPFFRAYLERTFENRRNAGSLDDLPDLWLRAYQAGALRSSR